MFQQNDAFRRMNEAVTKFGMSLSEAAEVIREGLEALFSAEVMDALAEIVVSIKYPTDEELRPQATAREWHLMNNAKKHRVRKKYRDRIYKRYYNDTRRS